ncbi:MAG: 1,4-alpha-glucan branching protein GlgB [Oscillospiraceae bacterium]|nr:1,4-alpha-glucan branching protein GlgB [Oscillospiraceae bacterium]
MNKEWQAYIPRDDIYLFNIGEAQRAWVSFGCTYIPELRRHRFLVWAPNARSVTIAGDFNGWAWDETRMERVEGGCWIAFVEGVWHGARYKYCVEGADGRRLLKSDPFAAFSQHSSETASIVFDHSEFQWNDGAYMAAREQRDFMTSPMSVYEVHASSWRALPGYRPLYRELADELSVYCEEMGFTHVEIMPVTEFPYDGSWGYQVTGYYAPTSRYGDPDDFRYLVDTLHRHGIGLIMDWVPAHFPKDEHGLARFDGTPQFECKEERMANHPEWGTLIFDYASDQVQSFLVSSACKFFEEFHIDGIRVDAVSSMLYLNYGRRDGEYTPNREGGNINLGAVEFLKKLNSTILRRYHGAITIAEESTAFPLITAPPSVGGLGFCFKWDMGFMHDTLDYMALDPIYRKYHHDKLTFSMMYAFSENYVLAYSHDEVVHGKRSMLNKMSGDYDQKFASLRTLYGYQFAHPGKKHTFMGGEFGQFIEWNWQQPLDWLLLDYPRHAQLREYVKELNRLYRSTPALTELDKSWDGFQWLNVDDRDRSAVAFLRMAPKAGSYLVCACNFTPVRLDGFVIGLPENGVLHELLSSDEERFGGGGVRNAGTIRAMHEAFTDKPWSARITIPPLSTVWFQYEKIQTGRKAK